PGGMLASGVTAPFAAPSLAGKGVGLPSQCLRPPLCLFRLTRASQGTKRIRSHYPCERVIRLERQRVVVSGQRLLVALEFAEGAALAHPPNRRRAYCQRTVVSDQRLIVALELEERPALVAPHP